MDASLEEESRRSDQVLRSRDLLQRLTDGDYRKNHTGNPREESEEVELSLGLSLGGKFGIDPKEGKLVRSSSIAGDFLSHLSGFSSPAILRTCSLPSVGEEEWRKRKEIQSMRRLEAKRKLAEKQRNCRFAKDRTVSEEACEEDRQTSNSAVDDITRFGGCQEENKQLEVPVSTGSCFDGLSSSSRVLNWAYPAHRQGQRSNKNDEKNLEFAPVGPSGCKSIGLSEIENELCRDVSNCETRSPATIHSLLETKPPKSPTRSSIMKCDSQSSESGESMNVMEQMPCVSTKGEGPNGRRIEGFLYKYRKGEELRIVCVCHGSFLTPAEFVKHAGGSDVAQPLKHIVRAIIEGAGFIETDILTSKDGYLISFHDVTLDATTNIVEHEEFRNRGRTYEVQVENITGWFVGMGCFIRFKG